MGTIPDRLLLHTVDVIRPGTTTDAYGNSVPDWDNATSETISARVQQDRRDETFPDGRNPQEQVWLLFTNHDDISTGDRVTWAGHPTGSVTFEVHGPPEHAYDGVGYHHVEATLRILEG